MHNRENKSFIVPGNVVLVRSAPALRNTSYSSQTNSTSKGQKKKKYFKAVVEQVYNNWALCQFRRDGFTLHEGFQFNEILKFDGNESLIGTKREDKEDEKVVY